MTQTSAEAQARRQFPTVKPPPTPIFSKTISTLKQQLHLKVTKGSDAVNRKRRSSYEQTLNEADELHIRINKIKTISDALLYMRSIGTTPTAAIYFLMQSMDPNLTLEFLGPINLDWKS